MKAVSLCSGYGGLEMAAEAIWPDLEVLWHAEIDPSAAKVFAAHWPDVPNLGDITGLEGVMPSDSPAVDVLTAGYP